MLCWNNPSLFNPSDKVAVSKSELHRNCLLEHCSPPWNSKLSVLPLSLQPPACQKDHARCFMWKRLKSSLNHVPNRPPPLCPTSSDSFYFSSHDSPLNPKQNVLEQEKGLNIRHTEAGCIKIYFSNFRSTFLWGLSCSADPLLKHYPLTSLLNRRPWHGAGPPTGVSRDVIYCVRTAGQKTDRDARFHARWSRDAAPPPIQRSGNFQQGALNADKCRKWFFFKRFWSSSAWREMKWTKWSEHRL